MPDEIKYELHGTDGLSVELEEEFLEVFNQVFSTNHDGAWFDWKYRKNIYGQSYIVFAFDQDKLVGIRSFWRNDVEEESYQPCDTAVLKEYRGRGIFSQSSRVALEKLDSYFIYNFPNENSLPGNLKMGWEIRNHFYLKTVISKRNLKKETLMIEDDYLNWRFIDCPTGDYYYYRRGEDYYLLVNRIRNIYYVLGRFKGEYREHFKEAKKPILFNYTDQETLMYKVLKNKANVVKYNNGRDVDVLPIFKADFF